MIDDEEIENYTNASKMIENLPIETLGLNESRKVQYQNTNTQENKCKKENSKVCNENSNQNYFQVNFTYFIGILRKRKTD
jgi:hypothetical protein